MPTLWLRELDGCSAEAAALSAALAAAGFEVQAGPQPGTTGVLLFACPQAAARFLVDAELSALDRVLAVHAGAAALSGPQTWHVLACGASDVVRWGEPAEALLEVLERVRRWAAVDELVASPVVRDNLVGQSPGWVLVLRQVVELALFTDASVLLLGETGTGKELVARLIHTLDRREGKGSLVTVDATALVPELSGSELFGHERGAYTGAVGAREGALALAHHGTLFLDEVGELPPSQQAQLLRAIQERTYKPVGGNTWHQVSFRLVCATHRDLALEVQAGRFRSDLYHRIATWRLRLPPLRERPQDVLALARHFAAELRGGASVLFEPCVEEYLLARDYPGNVRELRQVVTRIMQRHCGHGAVTAGALPEEERPHDGDARDWRDPGLERAIQRALAQGVALKDIGRGVTEVAVRMVVEQEHGNLQRAARKLGVTDRALQLRRNGKPPH